MKDVTTAFVLSGGGSLGAIQVGMLQALADRQVSPDLLVGTSAGALNAAYLAGHGTDRIAVDALAEVWTGLRTRDLFPISPRRVLAALLGSEPSFFSDHGLRELLRQHLTFEDLTEAPIPLVIVTTDLLTGREVALRDGDTASAVLASSAIPAVFPAVQRDGLTLVDGGLANNTAISQAVAAGADPVYVLPSGYACDLRRAPTTPVSTVLHTITLLIHQRLVDDIERYADQVELRVLAPPCPVQVSASDFSHARELMRAAYRAAEAQLADHDFDHPTTQIAIHVHDETQAPGQRQW